MYGLEEIFVFDIMIFLVDVRVYSTYDISMKGRSF